MAQAFDAEFIALSAVLSGVKDIRDAVAARRARRCSSPAGTPSCSSTRCTASTRRSRTPSCRYVERGLFTFIGATTENPSFEVNSALLSRAAVYVLQPLSRRGARGAVRARRSARRSRACVSARGARELLIGFADGDARRLYNMLEQIGVAAAEARRDGGRRGVRRATRWRRACAASTRAATQFYDQISALHKSVRGSAPDAALYWLMRMLDGGADPLYLGRRLVRMAVEDIGLADPRALRIALDACETYERLGSPGGRARARRGGALPRGRAEEQRGLRRVSTPRASSCSKDGSRPVPEHLRNAPTKLMKDLGYGKRLPLRARRARRLRRGGELSPGGHVSGELLPAHGARAGRRRSASSWSICASSTALRESRTGRNDLVTIGSR